MSLTDLKCNAWSLDIMGPSLHNEVLISTTNDFLYTLVIVQHMEKNLVIANKFCQSFGPSLVSRLQCNVLINDK